MSRDLLNQSSQYDLLVIENTKHAEYRIFGYRLRLLTTRQRGAIDAIYENSPPADKVE